MARTAYHHLPLPSHARRSSKDDQDGQGSSSLRRGTRFAANCFTGLPRTRKLQLLLGTIILVLIMCFPVIRHDYIKMHPTKAPEELQDPRWWIDPWNLPLSRFPKISHYPDPDWNPTPVWLNEANPSLAKNPGPSTFRCNDDTHPFWPVTRPEPSSSSSSPNSTGVPLTASAAHTPEFSGATASSPLLFLGIFTAAGKLEQRNTIRRMQLPHYGKRRVGGEPEGGPWSTPHIDDLIGSVNQTHPSHNLGDMGVPPGVLEAKFIVGYPSRWRDTIKMLQDGTLAQEADFDRSKVPQSLLTPAPVYHPAAESSSIPGDFVRWQGEDQRSWWNLLPRMLGWTAADVARAKEQLALMSNLAEEQAKFGDLVLLDLEDAVTQGKTYHYFRWLAKMRAHDRPPRFAMKTDDDTFHVIPNLLSIFAPLSCSTSYYIGNSWGCTQSFPFHFGGLGYALSWPLISWLGANDVPLAHNEIDQPEDARLGSFFQALDREREPIVTLDYGILMGSWWDDDVFPKSTASIALHYMKEPNVYRDYSSKMWNLWKTEGRKWVWPDAEAWLRIHSQTPAHSLPPAAPPVSSAPGPAT